MNTIDSFFKLAVPELAFLITVLLGVLLGIIQIVRQENQTNKKMNHELKNYNSQELTRTRIKFSRVVRQIFNIN